VTDGSAPRRARFGPPALCSAAVALLASGCSLALPSLFGGPEPLGETVVEGSGSAKILILDIEGVLSEGEETSAFGLITHESQVARVRQQLKMARKDSRIAALVLRIDSPGGTAAASDLLYHEVAEFKHEQNIPVLAQMMGVAASGGYYVAMAADAIYAQPTTVTGSIGVIFEGVNFAGLMGKLGVADQTLKSGAFKDAGSPLRPMTPAERAQLQSVIDELYARFCEVVAAGRPKLGLERVHALADGRAFAAPQALEAGLVDRIAYLPDAIDEARRRAGVAKARVILYRRDSEWAENIYSRAPLGAGPRTATPSPPGELRLDLGLGLRPPLRGPAFLYLWWPGLG
jgi:protease-4